MNWNSGRRNQRQHSGNNHNGGRSERNQGRAGGRAGVEGGLLRGIHLGGPQGSQIYMETEVKRVKRVPLLRSETQATVKGEAVVAANVLDTPTIVLLRRAG